MTKNDQDLIAEAYNKVNEGFFDRVKARASQAAGAVKGVGDRVKGAAKGAAGKALAGAADVGGKALGVDASQGGLAQKGAKMQKDAAKDTRKGKASGQEAKYASYIKNSANTIVKDLNKLGMEVDDPDALNQELQMLVSKHLTKVTTRGTYNRGGQANMGKKVGQSHMEGPMDPD
tara:strand:+ start:444 stop:968 length:525 start_codon:yes stop_codon:yes gene_type:complete